MAAGNGENFVTDNLDAIGGGDERGGGGGGGGGESVVSGREEIFETPEKKGYEEQIATAPVWGIGQRVKVLEKCDGIVMFVGRRLQRYPCRMGISLTLLWSQHAEMCCNRH